MTYQKILVIRIFCFIGPALTGLGLFGLFIDGGLSFFPLVNKPSAIYTICLSGIIIQAIEFSLLRPLWKQLKSDSKYKIKGHPS